MVSRILIRKLLRDVLRQRWQFLAAAAIIALGVAVFTAATDAYTNLKQSLDRAYAAQLLPDAIITGPAAFQLRAAAGQLPGDPVVDPREQGDVGIRINGHTLYGRAVSVPSSAQPRVSTLMLRSGTLPGHDATLVEEHLAGYYGLTPGDTIDLLGPGGWQTLRISGTASSVEYLRPARSEQEIMSSPDDFGVVFLPSADFPRDVSAPTDQLLVYARDRDAAPALVQAANQLARANGMSAQSRAEQPSFRRLREDVDSVGAFAKLLPWLFLTAGIVGAYALLSRLVAAQRAVLGTLSANGLGGGVLRAHYFSYGVVVGGLGACVGLTLGYLVGGWFSVDYTRALGVPLRTVSVHPATLLTGAAVGVAAASLAAWAPARAASLISPAHAMRTAPPSARGHVSLLETLLPVLRRLPARHRMTLRGVFRNPRRSILTVVGVVMSVSLLMVFAGLHDTASRFFDRQYGGIELQDAQVLTRPGSADAVAGQLRANSHIAAAEPFTRLDVSVRADHTRSDTLMVALPRQTEMHRFIDGRRVVELPADGVLMGKGLAWKLGVVAGQKVAIASTSPALKLQKTVTGLLDEPTSPVIYIAADALAAGTPASGVMVKLAPGVSQDQVSREVCALPGVAAYLSTAALAQTLRDAFSLYDTMVGLMQVFAAVMAAALLYNTMSINIRQRTAELGPLQAAGLSAGQLARCVAAENMLLVAIAMPIGLLVGFHMAKTVMATYQTDYRWHLDMAPTTPFIVVAAVSAATLLAQIPATWIIRRLDMAALTRERSP